MAVPCGTVLYKVVLNKFDLHILGLVDEIQMGDHLNLMLLWRTFMYFYKKWFNVLSLKSCMYV